jgi:hypothetical protein
MEHAPRRQSREMVQIIRAPTTELATTSHQASMLELLHLRRFTLLGSLAGCRSCNCAIGSAAGMVITGSAACLLIGAD